MVLENLICLILLLNDILRNRIHWSKYRHRTTPCILEFIWKKYKQSRERIKDPDGIVSDDTILEMERPHKQVWIKVNAKVDRGISNIVALLNEIDGLITLDSCEGKNKWSYVYFRYGTYQTICKLLFGRLAPALIKKYGEDVVLSAEVSSDLEPIGKIAFRKELTNKLFLALQVEINACHKCS